MSFGKIIKELRMNSGLTQAELGQKIGAGKSSVCCWERENYVPRAGEIIAIAKYFNVSTDYLLGLQTEVITK